METKTICGILMDHSCQKVLLVLAQLGFQTFTSSTLHISFFSIKKWTSIYLYLKQINGRFEAAQIMISTSELEFWKARGDKSDFSSDQSRTSNSSFSKPTAVNSCIMFWIDAFIILQGSNTEKSLVSFLTLAWILPSRSPSTTFFSKECVFF